MFLYNIYTCGVLCSTSKKTLGFWPNVCYEDQNISDGRNILLGISGQSIVS